MLEENLMKVWAAVKSPNFTLSFSSLNELLESNLHFARYVAKKYGWFDTDDDRQDALKVTDAVKVGDCVDSYIFDRLGNTKLGRNDGFRYYPIKEPLNLTRKEDKEKFAAHVERANGLEVIRVDAWNEVRSLLNVVEYQPYAWGLLHDWIIDIQQPIQMQHNATGCIIRGRYDAIGQIPDTNEYYCVDLKSMSNGVSDKKISSTVRERRYHLQAYLYREMLELMDFPITDSYIIGIAKNGCNVKKFRDYDIQDGKMLYQLGMNRFEEILLSNNPNCLLQSYDRLGFGWSYL